MKKAFSIHYSEIGTKGKNRNFFESKLSENIKKSLLKKGLNFELIKQYGRIICFYAEKSDIIEETLSKIPGVAVFLEGYVVNLDFSELKTAIEQISSELDFVSFRVETKRPNKQFIKTSQEVNVELGRLIVEKFNKKVDLKKPDLTFYVEISEKLIFIGIKKSKSIGGLPVGSSGKVIASLSGGIDSPVASYMMMKRGCKVVFMHAFNRTIVSRKVQDKLIKIVKKLNEFQLESKFYVVPFLEIQNAIIENVPERYRMIIYRRFMMQILNHIAEKENIKAIVTGDSVGQVASQTLNNINCIYEAARFPVFNPLIGFNKEEIVKIAEQIGTYEISILPYADCCSYMIAKSPETSGNLELIKKAEDKVPDKDLLVRKAVSEAEIIRFS